MENQSEIKEKILKIETMDELIKIENEEYKKFRDDFYNELLKDDNIKKHISDISGIEINAIKNLLMINDNSPLDYFDDNE